MIPSVSLIVPVYNVRPYIHKCIKSILNQTFTDFELILVDDGSDDGSGDVCDQYAISDSRIIVIHKNNGGQSSARNTGLEIAKGRYIGFVDADDYIAPSMVETLFDLAAKYDADITECGYKSIFPDKELICEFGNGLEFGEGDFLVEKYIKGDIFYGIVTKFFKKGLFNKIRFPEGRIYEDTWMTLYFCLDKLRYVRIDDPLYFYVQTYNSTLRSEVTQRKAREYIYILESQLEMINEKVSDIQLKNKLHTRIMEKSVVWYLGLALSEKKILRRIYSRLYLMRMDYSILQCIKSSKITVRNKMSYIFCRAGLNGAIRLSKKILSR